MRSALVLAARQGLDVSNVSEARVLGDADQLARVIRNLVENAQRFASSSVSVGVSIVGRPWRSPWPTTVPASPGHNGTECSIGSRGWTKLEAVAQAVPELGLSIAKEIVAAHRGSITVKEATKGIVVRLPRDQARGTGA